MLKYGDKNRTGLLILLGVTFVSLVLGGVLLVRSNENLPPLRTGDGRQSCHHCRCKAPWAVSKDFGDGSCHSMEKYSDDTGLPLFNLRDERCATRGRHTDRTIFDFDKNTDLFYLNLDRATDRKKSIEQQFKKQGLKVKRHRAVDGTKIDLEDPKYVENLKHTKFWYAEDKRRLGHFACFLSHLEILQECFAKQSPYVVIFEDDAEFLGSDFKQKIYENMRNVPSDWDIILFGYSVDDSTNQVKEGNKRSQLKDGIINLNYFTGMHGYLVRNKALPVLLRELPKHEWLLDWHLSYLAERGQIKIYAIFPPLLCQPGADRVKLHDIDHELKCDVSLGSSM